MIARADGAGLPGFDLGQGPSKPSAQQWRMDALSHAIANNYLRKAAELRQEAEKIDDPIVIQRMLRLAERWEGRAREQSNERH